MDIHVFGERSDGGLSRSDAENTSSYCPACSQRLEALGCKLVCPVCGYYMSCSDYP